MAYKSVPARRIGALDEEPGLRAVLCPRCGRRRQAHSKRVNPLCSDCKYVLSNEEIEMWKKDAA